MDKELLIQKLNAFKDTLPENIEGVNREQALTSSKQAYSSMFEEMKELELGKKSPNELAVESDKIKLDYLNADKANLEDEMRKTAAQIASINKHIDSLIAKASKDLEKEIEKRRKYIDLYKIEYDKGRISKSEYQKNIDELTNEIDELSNSRLIENRNAEIEAARKRVEELRELQQQNNANLQQYKNKINALILSIREKEKDSPLKSEDRIKELEENLDALDMMSGFLQTDLRKEVDDIIAYLGNDIIDEDEVQRRINNLNALANSNLYDLRRNKPNEARMAKKMEEVDKRREELIAKTSDENNYVVASAEYDTLSNNMEIYRERVEEIDRIDDAEKRELERLRSEIAGIPYYKNFIKEAQQNIKQNESKEVIDEETKKAIKLDKDKIKRYKKIVSELEDPVHMEAVKGRIKVLENQSYARSLDRASYVTLYENAAKRLYTINETDEQKDLKELEKLTTLKKALENEFKVLRNSPLYIMDEIAALVNGKEVSKAPVDPDKEKVAEPSFLASFTPAQRELYDKVMNGLPLEDKKDVKEDLERMEPVAAPVVTPKEEKEEKKDEPKVAPVAAPIKATPKKKKVKAVKDLEPSKLEKIKSYFKRNWKKIVATLAMAAALAVSIKACNVAKDYTPDAPVVTPGIVEIEVAEPKLPEKIVVEEEKAGTLRAIKEVTEKEYREKEHHHKLELPEEDEVVTEEEFLDAARDLEGSEDITPEEQKLIDKLLHGEEQEKEHKIETREVEIEDVVLDEGLANEVVEYEFENPVEEIRTPIVDETPVVEEAPVQEETEKKSSFPTNPDEIDYSRGVGLRFNPKTGQWEQYYLDEDPTLLENADWLGVDDVLEGLYEREGRGR